jgi:hypothetical protein
MRRLQLDRRGLARRARIRKRPYLGLDEAVQVDDRAAAVRANAAKLTQRAARFLSGSQTPSAAAGCHQTLSPAQAG